MASLRRVMPSSWRASRRLLSRVTAMWANSLTGRTSCDLLIAQCATRQGHALLRGFRTVDYPTPVVPCPYGGQPALDGRRQGLQGVRMGGPAARLAGPAPRGG